MRITRVHATADGESHFGEIDVSLLDAGEISRLSPPFAARIVSSAPVRPG